MWGWALCVSASTTVTEQVADALYSPRAACVIPLVLRLLVPLPLRLRLSQFPTRFDEDGMLRQSARAVDGPLPRPLATGLWAAGFSFTSSRAIALVPYDPSLLDLFFGEEISMAAR